MPERFITLQNQEQINYRIENEEQNNQTTIVLIHGNMSTLGWWDEVVNNLIDTKRKILAINLRGFGKSSYNNPCKRFGDWAKDVIQLLHLLKINKVILNGWSFGGAVVQKIADMAPELVQKIILTCSVSHEGLVLYNQKQQACKTAQQIIQIPKIAGTYSVINTKNKQVMKGIFQMILFKKMAHISQERKAQLMQNPFEQRCYIDLMVALANSDINVQNIKAPTLLIHGNEDNVLPIQTILGTAGKLGKLDVWQNHYHMIPLEDINRYVDTVKKFIE